MALSKRTLRDKVLLILKGTAMGIANIIPGVSGGIVPLVGGFYEEFIYSLKKINLKALKLLFNGHFKLFFKYTNFSFLLLLFSGVGISYIISSFILDYLFENYEKAVWSFFMGIILASVFYISKQEKNWKTQNFIFLFSGILIGLVISFLSPSAENSNLFFVFLCGLLSVCGMVLPGLSGSFILVIMGNYSLILVDSINAIYFIFIYAIKGDFGFLQNTEQMNFILIFFVFIIGSIIGIVSFSRLLSYVLKKYKSITIAILIGFICGTLRVIWPWRKNIEDTTISVHHNKVLNLINYFELELPDIFLLETWVLFFFILLGICFVFVLEITTNRKKTSDISIF